MSIVTISILAAFFILFAVVFLTPSHIKLDEKKMINTSDFVNFYDTHNNLVAVDVSGNIQQDKAEINSIIKQAFVASEDKNFYKHRGVDFKRILKAVYVNLKNMSFKQGASTISQQLIKNTHLSNKKTISRKITEIKLTRKLEQKYTKDEILAMYLNSIYFGENTYGIYNAAMHYFNKKPQDLNLGEIATLAGIISAPSRLNPNIDPISCKQKRNVVLERMFNCGYITKDQLEEEKIKPIITTSPVSQVFTCYINATLDEMCSLLDISPYEINNYNVYTYYDKDLQEKISDYTLNCDYQNIVLDNKTMGITAYYSTCGEILREPASLIKPILVYGPAIEDDLINEYTLITDEKTSFGDYTPKNSNDKYCGSVCVKDALIKSLNVPAVKIANMLGVKKIKKYASMMNIQITNDGLSVALGNTGNGLKLSQISGGYGALANYGSYKIPHFIRKITDLKGRVIYESNQAAQNLFSSSTGELLTHMLMETKQNGTAKKLSYIPFDLAVKTGTNGTAAGNVDCYACGYTSENIFCVWIGNRDYSPLENNMTGSNLPTQILGQTVEHVYRDKRPQNFSFPSLTKLKLDKYAYEEFGEILLSSDNTPDNQIFEGMFKNNHTQLRKSNYFEQASISDVFIELKDNVVYISYGTPKNGSVEIYRTVNNVKTLVYVGNEPFSEKLSASGLYTYSIIPICKGKREVKGQEITLKSLNLTQNDDNKDSIPKSWWIDE